MWRPIVRRSELLAWFGDALVNRPNACLSRRASVRNSRLPLTDAQPPPLFRIHIKFGQLGLCTFRQTKRPLAPGDDRRDTRTASSLLPWPQVAPLAVEWVRRGSGLRHCCHGDQNARKFWSGDSLWSTSCPDNAARQAIGSLGFQTIRGRLDHFYSLHICAVAPLSISIAAIALVPCDVSSRRGAQIRRAPRRSTRMPMPPGRSDL